MELFSPSAPQVAFIRDMVRLFNHAPAHLKGSSKRRCAIVRVCVYVCVFVCV